jgi:hypothetical protein
VGHCRGSAGQEIGARRFLSNPATLTQAGCWHAALLAAVGPGAYDAFHQAGSPETAYRGAPMADVIFVPSRAGPHRRRPRLRRPAACARLRAARHQVTVLDLHDGARRRTALRRSGAAPRRTGQRAYRLTCSHHGA